MKKNVFPVDEYTPFGYIDNPYHSWKLHRSGVIRVSPPCGMGWIFPNAHKPIYSAALNIGIKTKKTNLLLKQDWQQSKIELISNYHSKEIFNFHWQVTKLVFDVNFYLLSENVLGCEILIKNNSQSPARFELLLQNSITLEYGQTGLWDFGLSGSFNHDLVLKSFAEGLCFITAADRPGELLTITEDYNQIDLKARLSNPYFATREKSIYGILSIPVELEAQQSDKIICFLARNVSEALARSELKSVTPKAASIYKKKKKSDDTFWNLCPQLHGDWPNHWRRGWVYDWETMRMNVRNPIGIFSTPWDAMQIQKSRMVLAETALDMMMMSYADPNLGKDVILGMFKDALAPQVPCSREDGSLNMIAEDGSECGTSPAWCFPFYCFLSIQLRHADRKWLKQLYPHLEAFLQWWLKYRTDEDGWAVYKCSWESGQDGSSKFFVKQPTGGEIVSHMRSVDLQAGMVLSFKIMESFAALLKKDGKKWKKLRREFEEKLQTMWRDNWYCDYNTDTKTWVNDSQYIDITNLAPFLLDNVPQHQIEAILPKFEYFKTNRKLWLEWASFFFMYICNR